MGTKEKGFGYLPIKTKGSANLPNLFLVKNYLILLTVCVFAVFVDSNFL